MPRNVKSLKNIHFLGRVDKKLHNSGKPPKNFSTFQLNFPQNVYFVQIKKPVLTLHYNPHLKRIHSALTSHTWITVLWIWPSWKRFHGRPAFNINSVYVHKIQIFVRQTREQINYATKYRSVEIIFDIRSRYIIAE